MFIQKLTDALTACVAYVDRNRWLFPLLLVAITAVHLSTLTISPPYWQDEMQIIEMGRNLLNEDSTYSMNWLMPKQEPFMFYPFVLTTSIQEWIFQASGFNIGATRLVCIFAALISTLIIYAFLRSCSVTFGIAAITSVLFYLDPLFTQSFKAGRTDAFAFAFILGFIWLCNLHVNISDIIQRRFVWLSSAVLLALSPFVWASVIILYPLVAWIYLKNLLLAYKFHKKKIFHELLLLPVITVASFIVLIFVVLGGVDFLGQSSMQRASGSLDMRDFSGFFKSLLNTLRYTPFLFLISLFSIFSARLWGLGVAMLFAILLIWLSGVYVFRSLYLLPYLLIFSAIAWQHMEHLSSKWCKFSFRIVFIFALVWAIGITGILRPVTAFSEEDGRNIDSVEERLDAISIQEGVSVAVEPWELYPYARKNNWQLYRPFDFTNVYPIDKRTTKKFVDRVDYIMVHNRYEMLQPLVKHYKYELIGHIDRLDVQSSSFLPFKQPFAYGPYRIYKKVE